MVSHANKGAEQFLPAEINLPALEGAAGRCQGCDLYLNATQTVFGEGPPDARLMFVGEQPGDQEDLKGAPFVGPAGRVLDRALQELGIDLSARSRPSRTHARLERAEQAITHPRPA